MSHPSLKDAINTSCPWSGNAVSPEALTTYKDHVVGFCNTGCRDKFEKATAMFDTAIRQSATHNP